MPVTRRILWRLAAGAIATVAAATAVPASAHGAPAEPTAPLRTASADVIEGSYIVVYKKDAASPAKSRVESRARSRGAQIGHRYGSALQGFSAKLSAAALDEVRRDSTVAYVETDSMVFPDATASWGIDRHAESLAGKAVVGKGKFQVAQRNTENMRKTVKLQEDFWTGSTKIQGGSGFVSQFAQDAGADYVLLIGPAPMGDPFMNTNQSLSGYGIYQRSFIGMRRALNFITMKAILVDGKTGGEVARTQCVVSAPRQESEWLEPNKVTQVDDGTRSGIEKLFDEALRKCLGNLNLV